MQELKGVIWKAGGGRRKMADAGQGLLDGSAVKAVALLSWGFIFFFSFFHLCLTYHTRTLVYILSLLIETLVCYARWINGGGSDHTEWVMGAVSTSFCTLWNVSYW